MCGYMCRKGKNKGRKTTKDYGQTGAKTKQNKNKRMKIGTEERERERDKLNEKTWLAIPRV